jgi:prepilin-type N-terminal cleavage/methylation domain-containing protein
MKRAFTLIELLLAIVIFLGILTAVIYNFDRFSDKVRYYEARDNLKTFLINLKYQSAFQQKEFELTFDENYNMYSSLSDIYQLDMFTNDLKVLETSSTRIVFFLDGSVQESYIVTSSLDGTITNTFIINVLGKVDIKNENSN